MIFAEALWTLQVRLKCISISVAKTIPRYCFTCSRHCRKNVVCYRAVQNPEKTFFCGSFCQGKKVWVDTAEKLSTNESCCRPEPLSFASVLSTCNDERRHSRSFSSFFPAKQSKIDNTQSTQPQVQLYTTQRRQFQVWLVCSDFFIWACTIFSF